MGLVDYLNNNPKNQLIFDFDNTLVSLQIAWDKWPEAIEAELELLDQAILAAYQEGQLNLSELQNSYVEKFGRRIRDKIIAHCGQFEGQYLRGYKVNEELISEIDSVEGTKYIWTSNARSTVVAILNELGILGNFEKIIARDDVTFIKPKIDGFEFLYDPKTQKESYLLVGDSGSDAKAASEAAISFYKITYFGDFANL